MDFFRTYRCSVFLKQITDSKHKYLKRTRLKTSSVPDREILRLKWNLKYPYIFNFIDLFDFFKNTFKLVQSIIQSKPNYCMYFQNKFKLVQSIASLFKKGKKNRMSNKNQDLYYWTKRNQGSIYFSSQCLQVWQILKADSASCKRGKFYHQWPWWKKALEWLKGLQMFRPSKNFRGFIDPQRYLGALGFKWPPGGFKGHWGHRI